MLNLNRFSIFFKWKVFDFFVIEEIKTCTIDACSQASTYSGFKYNWSNAPCYLKSWILRSLPNTKLLNRSQGSQGFCSCSEQLLLVISNGSCQYYFLLLDILVVPSCINYILLRKYICPKCFSFYRPSSYLRHLQQPNGVTKFENLSSILPYISYLFLYKILCIVKKNKFRRKGGCNCNNGNYKWKKKEKRKEKQKKKHDYLVKSWLSRRKQLSACDTFLSELRSVEIEYKHYLRINLECFNQLFELVKDDITKNKNMWHATPPILKLAAISPESSRESMTVSKASPSFEIFLDFLLSRKNIYILLFFIFSSYKLN